MKLKETLWVQTCPFFLQRFRQRRITGVRLGTTQKIEKEQTSIVAQLHNL